MLAAGCKKVTLAVRDALYLVVLRVVTVVLFPLAYLYQRFYHVIEQLASYSDIAWAVTHYDCSRNSVGVHHVSDIKEGVINSTRVKKAIAYDPSGAQRFGGAETRSDSRRIRHRTMLAEKMVDDMGASQRMWVIRIAAYILRKAFGLLYECGVHVDQRDLERLRSSIDRAKQARSNCSVIYLPTHKSHLDYMLMTYICFRESLPMPIVVAGDNLNMPIVGSFLRACGAFFIRRSFRTDNDPLYSTIFREYIKHSLGAGLSLEAFIEGGRSRTGKVLTPKTGVLQAVVDAVRDGHVPDVLIVPIAFSYERIVENESHVQELSGARKRKEQLTSAFKSVLSVLAIARNACFGRVEATIASPMSVRDLMRANFDSLSGKTKARKLSLNSRLRADDEDELAEIAELQRTLSRTSTDSHHDEVETGTDNDDIGRCRLSSTASTDSTVVTTGNVPPRPPGLPRHDTVTELPMSPATRRDISYSLGYRVLYETNAVTLVLPAAVVATALLTEYARGVGYDELVRKVFWIKKEIEHRGGRVADFETDTIDRIIYQVLGSKYAHNELVKRHKNRLMVSLYNPKERMELSLYRNQLIHYFVPEGILCCALYAFEKESTTYPVTVPRGELLTPVKYLSVLFQLEFIYQSRPGGIQTNLDSTLDLMVERGILNVTKGKNGMVSVNEDVGVERYLFLCKLFWHFIDSYWFVLLGGYFLLPNRALSEEALIQKVQEVGEALYFHGEADLCEAICKETLQNALTLYEKQGVYEFVRIEGVESNFVSKGRRIVKLTQAYQSESAIEQKLLELTRYRKKARQYSSRRFKVKRGTDVRDAIRTVRKMIEEEKHKKDWEEE